MVSPPTSIEILLSDLGAFAVGAKRTERDLLCLMILFHTHRLEFQRPILPQRPGILRLAALTQRSVAAIAADAWPKRKDTERTSYVYWYHLFNASGPFEVWRMSRQICATRL
jgi:hypothetical protein